MLQCILSRVGATWQNFFGVILPPLLTIIAVVWGLALLQFIALVALASPLSWASVGTAALGAFGLALIISLVLLGIALVLLLANLLVDVLICAFSSTFPPPPPSSGSGGSPLTGDISCEAAQRALADAQARVAALARAAQDQAVEVRRAQDRVNATRMLLTGAIVSLGVAFFTPWAIPAALAAMAATTLLMRNAVRDFAQASQRLLAASLALALAQRELERARVQAELSCATSVEPAPLYPVLPVTGVTVMIGLTLPPPLPTTPRLPGDTV